MPSIDHAPIRGGRPDADAVPAQLRKLLLYVEQAHMVTSWILTKPLIAASLPAEQEFQWQTVVRGRSLDPSFHHH